MIILDVEDIFDETPALIIAWPTGIKYTAQTGGLGCDNPQCEGFAIALPQIITTFDDCSYGCYKLSILPAAREKLADDLDYFFKESSLGYIRIDRELLNELSEGWWPVIYSAPFREDGAKVVHKEIFKGYIHAGNCD